MPEVLEIEKENFEIPWTENDFNKALRTRNCIGMVIEVGGTVDAPPIAIGGFMVYELHKNKLVLVNFAVKKDMHKQGLGSKMIQKLISKLSVDRRKKIELYLRESNLTGQLFFSKLGFKAVHVERQFYEDTGEDAYLMKYLLPNADDVETEEVEEQPFWD